MEVRKQLGVAITALALAVPHVALADPQFSIFVDGLGCSSLLSISNSATPVSGDRNCGNSFGSFDAEAHSTYGSIGASARASTFNSVAAGTSQANAGFFDLLVISKTDPSAPDVFLTSINLAFGGTLNAGGIVDNAASVGITVAPFTGLAIFTVNDGLQVANGLLAGGVVLPGPTAFDSSLTTPQFPVQVGLLPFGLNLAVIANSANTGGSATADFGSTLELPTGIDVFNLPPGYTVNNFCSSEPCVHYLVNNRFIDADAIPAPASLLLLLTGLFGFALSRNAQPPQLSRRRCCGAHLGGSIASSPSP
jgi:hypothetical protein